MGDWKTIVDRWLACPAVAGVHVRWLSSQQCVYSLCILQKHEQLISVVVQQAELTTPEELFTHLKPSIPVLLSIEGKGILVRQVATVGEEISDIIPNAKAEDFYVIQHPHQLVSMARREVIDRMVDTFTQQGLYVLAVHTGPFALNAVLPFLPGNTADVSLPGQQLLVRELQISEVKPEGDSPLSNARYTIGEETIPARSLLAYATALTHFVPTESSLAQSERQREYWHRRLFTKALPVVLGFFLLVLLVNTIVYTQAFQINQTLVTQASASTQVLQRLTALQQKVADKEKFLATLNWERTDSKAALADRLAATLPTEVVLTDLQISPLHKTQYQKEKKKVFDSHTLYVAGRCDDLVILNRWLSQLEAEPWIAQLREQQYTSGQDHHSGHFSFTVVLQP